MIAQVSMALDFSLPDGSNPRVPAVGLDELVHMAFMDAADRHHLPLLKRAHGCYADATYTAFELSGLATELTRLESLEPGLAGWIERLRALLVHAQGVGVGLDVYCD